MFEDKKKYCLNCGKKYHITVVCPEPIISYGIINFKLIGEYEKYNSIFKNKYIIKEYNPNINKINLFWFNNKNMDKICDELNEKIKDSMLFLMISRKNSLGYIEFIRGRYEINDLNTVKYLMEQMTELEIIKILMTESFDVLWCELWKKTAKNKVYEKEYNISCEKFNSLKSLYLNEISLFKPKYPTSEWGFPKGRRKLAERDMKCAIRECCEETSLDFSEINILDRIYPLSEQFKGTNNIDYKHTYYLSIVETNRNLSILTTPEQHIEIDTVGWFKYDRVMNLIRPYHKEKKKLVDDIIKFVVYNILWIEQTNKN
jgi:ADP-ribose pyrophosphatase YjhB (NUDIX family)